jgi:CP family cyanate transporter-like MFS transporter
MSGAGAMTDGGRLLDGPIGLAHADAELSAVSAAGRQPARWLVVAVVVLVGLNLRPFITGVGPLAEGVQAETRLGLQRLALLTLVPMLLMGGFAFAGPTLNARVGTRRSVVGALVILAAGSLLRLFASTGSAMVGTAALLGLGAAVVQALFPGILKEQFPRRVGIVTGLYSAMLMVGGALGAQLSPMVAEASGSWHAGLAWPATLALAAVALAAACLPPDPGRKPGRSAASGLLRRPRTWLQMACFGLVNGGFSTVVASLAPSYQAYGWTGAGSGGLLAVLSIAQAAAALLVPVLASRRDDHRP